MHIVLCTALGAILCLASLGKLRHPDAAAGLIAAVGWRAGGRRLAVGLLAGAELVLGVLLLVPATATVGAVGATALLSGAGVVLLAVRLRGQRRTRCGCFGGSRERPTSWLVARALALAALALVAALGTLDRPAPSREVALTAVVAVLAPAVGILAVGLLALYRQVGVLESRLGPTRHLELVDEGPPLGRPAPALPGLTRRGGELVAFGSPGCRLCEDLAPSLAAVARRGLSVTAVSEYLNPDAFERFHVPGTPFVVYLVEGIVAAKGLVNSLEQLEALVDVGDGRALRAA